MDVVEVDGRLVADDIRLAAGPLRVKMSEATQQAIVRCRDYVTGQVAHGRPIYGITTGYGALVGHAGNQDEAARSRGLVDFLTVGQGEPLPVPVARGMLLVRLASMCRGRSGVSLEAVDALTAFLTTPLAPVVPEFGSVGASGDLAPLAHAVQALTGRGEVIRHGVRLPAGEALRAEGLAPLVMSGRDALALVNGTSLTAAAAALAVSRARRCLITALTLSAALTEVLGATSAFTDDQLASASGHGQVRWAAHRIRDLLAGATVGDDRPLQEAYSLRCTPQLIGAASSALLWACGVIEDDLNGVSDNPLFFPDTDTVAHGGNFFGQSVAFAADLISNTTTQLANLAERQLDLLVDPHRNGGLPALLTTDPGRQHGLTGLQISATSIVAGMRRDATPAGMQSIPTNLHNQDIVPFGNQAALTALRQSERLGWVQGMLALALRQAFHLRGQAPTGVGGRTLIDALAAIAPVTEDRPLDADTRLAADTLDRIAEHSATGLGQ